MKRLSKILFGLPIGVGIVFCFIPGAQATERLVCKEWACTYKTVQSAITASSNGDTVIVSGGTYQETIKFNGKAITVRSKYGATVTILDKKTSSERRTVYFSNYEDENSVLDGFTITNTDATIGGGIRCENSAPTIKNCLIKNNTNEYGGGLRCDNASPNLLNCTFKNNLSQADGGGMYLLNSAPTLESCTITSNWADNNGGGVACDDSSPQVINSYITYNKAADFGGMAIGDGGGMYAKSKSSPKITGSYIQNNYAKDDGGGIASDTSSSPTIESSYVQNNRSDDNGAGFYCLTASPTLKDCTVTGNVASGNGRGGAMYCANYSSPTVTAGSMSSNSDSAGASEIYLNDATSTVSIK